MCAQIDQDDIEAMMSVADPDEDGRVSLKDFSTISSYMPPELDPSSPECLLLRKKGDGRRG